MKAVTMTLAGLVACLCLAVPASAAEDASTSGASLAVRRAPSSFLQAACGAGRALGLCAAEETGTRRGLSLSVLKGIGSLSPKTAPNKFFQLVKLFIDDLEVAQVGNTRIRLSIELR